MVSRCRVPVAYVRPADVSPSAGTIVGVLASHENSALGVCSIARPRQLANSCRLPQPCRACLRGVLTSQHGQKASGHLRARFGAALSWHGSWVYGHAEKLCSGVSAALACSHIRTRPMRDRQILVMPDCVCVVPITRESTRLTPWVFSLAIFTPTAILARPFRICQRQRQRGSPAQELLMRRQHPRRRPALGRLVQLRQSERATPTTTRANTRSWSFAAVPPACFVTRGMRASALVWLG